jgi:ATP-binding cassette subfamily B protein
MSPIKKIPLIIKNLLFSIDLCYKASKKYFAIKIFIVILNTMFPFANIFLWKHLLNMLAKSELQYQKIMCLSITYLLVRTSIYFINIWDTYVNKRYSDEMHFFIDNAMINKLSQIDLSFFESATMCDKVRQIRQNFDYIKKLVNIIFALFTKIMSVCISIVALVSIRWWLPIIIAFLSMPHNIYNYVYTKKSLQIEKNQTRDNRKMEYFSQSFYNSEMQFEFKLNQTGEVFINKFKSIWSKLYSQNRKRNNKHEIVTTLLFCVETVGDIIILLLSIQMIQHNNCGIGDIQYNMRMGSRFKNQTNGLISEVTAVFANDTKIQELRDFLAIQSVAEKGGTLLPSKCPKIEFCQVKFKYPNSDRLVLDDCSFIIEPHEKIGLVGSNGSGKSTILKLLFRFYDPCGGIIKIDGVDIKEYNIYALRKMFGIVFQDQVTYCLPLREIIALPKFDCRFDEEAMNAACIKSGLISIIKDWEDGYDSVLGRYYASNGKNLSGGQWKTLGITRAYFQQSDYMICDEPSASLDAISEKRIFMRLLELSGDNNSIIISHQMANTTSVDRILVVDKGKIVEQGTHDALMIIDGIYANYYNIQAKKYK